MKDAGLYEDSKVWDFGEGWNVDTQHFHSELPVAVPHGDGENSLVVLLSNGQLLMSGYEEQDVREGGLMVWFDTIRQD